MLTTLTTIFLLATASESSTALAAGTGTVPSSTAPEPSPIPFPYIPAEEEFDEVEDYLPELPFEWHRPTDPVTPDDYFPFTEYKRPKSLRPLEADAVTDSSRPTPTTKSVEDGYVAPEDRHDIVAVEDNQQVFYVGKQRTDKDTNERENDEFDRSNLYCADCGQCLNLEQADELDIEKMLDELVFPKEELEVDIEGLSEGLASLMIELGIEPLEQPFEVLSAPEPQPEEEQEPLMQYIRLL